MEHTESRRADNHGTADEGTTKPFPSSASVILTDAQRSTLHVLGYLFLRMGQFERAKLLFSAMAALDPADRWTRRNLAATYLALGDGAAALEQLRAAVGDGLLPSRDAVLHLLRARALWQQGREDEARDAANAYLATSGEAGNPLRGNTATPGKKL